MVKFQVFRWMISPRRWKNRYKKFSKYSSCSICYGSWERVWTGKGYSAEAKLFGKRFKTEDEKRSLGIKGNSYFITVNKNKEGRGKLMIVVVEEQSILPIVIKSKNNVPTVIEWNGKRYVLDHTDQFKPKKKSIKN